EVYALSLHDALPIYNPDSVAKIVLSSPEGTITLVRETGDRWSALERYGYPVDPARVRNLVVTLADMRLIERKTAQPEYYDRLEVEAPDAENAKSELVRLEAADGSVLAEAIIGKQRYRLTGTEPSGTYLRRPDEAQSWLASGGLQIDREVARWLQGEIVDVDPDTIRRIEIERAGEPSYAVVRDEPGGELRLATLADDEQLKDGGDFGRLTGALSRVRLDDVAPRDELAWPSEQHVARIETFDGLGLTVRLAEIDDAHWAMFDASAVAPSEPAVANEAEPAVTADDANPDETAAADQGEEQSADDEATAEAASEDDAAPTEKAAEAEAAPIDPEQLNERVGKWAYRIPEYLFNRLSTARSQFLADQDGPSSRPRPRLPAPLSAAHRSLPG